MINLSGLYDVVVNNYIYGITVLAILLGWYFAHFLKKPTKPVEQVPAERIHEIDELSVAEDDTNNATFVISDDENLDNVMNSSAEQDQDNWNEQNITVLPNNDSEESGQAEGIENLEFPIEELKGKFKTARLRQMEAELTRDQLQEERRVEQEQLAVIYDLLKKQEAELKMNEINEKELKAQLNLYR